MKPPEPIIRCPECERMRPKSRTVKGKCEDGKACAKARAALLKVLAEDRKRSSPDKDYWRKFDTDSSRR